jgi:hypothetical protein
MRLPRRPPVRRLPGWPPSAGPHPKGWWRGRRCWSLRLNARPGEPPLTHVGLWVPAFFASERLPRALALQYRHRGRWRLAARWSGDEPFWAVTLPQPQPASSLRVVWSAVRAETVLPWHSLRRGGWHEGLSQLAALGCDAFEAPPGLRRRTELMRARLVARSGAEAPRGLQITWYGRFGNAALQIVNALQLADALGLEEVALPHLAQLRLPSEGDGGRPRLVPLTGRPRSPRLRNRYFLISLYRAVGLRPPDERYRLAQMRLRPLLDPAWWQREVPDDELVVHLRGGDVFQPGWVHPSYIQPPLAFYRRAVAAAALEAPLTRVRLVSEDRANPCLEPLAAWIERLGLPVTVRSSHFGSDLGALLGARRLVASNSTLLGAVALLSDRLRTLYSFRRESLILPGDETGIVQHWGVAHRCFVERAEGYPRAGGWRNTPEQRALMLDTPDEALEALA